MKNILKIIILLITFVLFLFIFLKMNNEESRKIDSIIETYKTFCGEYKKGEVEVGDKILQVDIADDDCKRTLGLSGKQSLNDIGMLFVFEKAENYSFWMKDMNFPIDIVWIDDTFSVVGIEKNLSPSTYPKSYGREYKALYVLEVQANFSEKNNIKITDKITFTQK